MPVSVPDPEPGAAPDPEPGTGLDPAPGRTTPPAWLVYSAVFAGGMLGGSTRYLIDLAIPAQPGQIPWGILGINLVGAFSLALLLAGWARRGHVAHPWRPFLATGILGSFTTWSTFMGGVLSLVDDGAMGRALVYLFGATAAGVGAAAAGWWTAQQVVRHVDDGVPA